ncbi:Crp/Fnr family transcriptional regulator [Cupriavidus basilensis]|uniref:Crp/Fnr family transcriptional regulator n=1 Tax=Cupriavidus TaxID=106589 RepID=UPI000452A804|nr:MULTISPECIES: Crp/Fnr family transcriptional regulator [Cupriavidus]KDP83725.1 Crp/Fnr family transcriptional regulator [Cupriavidus sp. SK-3]MDF3887333.1 Crp/Fnr family transcriptional regulator [Cupriavidus basilensis]
MSKPFTTEDRLAALKSSAWFAGLTAGLQGWIAEHSRVRALAAGEPLFRRGDAPDGLYFVVDGAVRMTRTSEQGKEALLAFAEAPQWFGEISLFDGLPRTHDAWVQSDAMLLHTPQSDLLHFLAQNPSHWRAFGLLLTQKLRLTLNAIEASALLPAPVRLAQRLLAIAGGYGERHGRSKRVIHVQQEELGLMLSVSRQTVNQILKDLELRGVLHRTRGAIEILDIEQLRAFANAG